MILFFIFSRKKIDEGIDKNNIMGLIQLNIKQSKLVAINMSIYL
jgi:hypothetical protein